MILAVVATLAFSAGVLFGAVGMLGYMLTEPKK